MRSERSKKRSIRDVSLAATIALLMTLSTLVTFSPAVSATPNVLRLLTSEEWDQDSPTGIFSVTAADLDGDGTVEVIVGGTSYPYQPDPRIPPPPPSFFPRGYLAVFHYGGCRKTLQLLDYDMWSASSPNEDTAVRSVIVGDFDTSVESPGLEIVTAGYTMVTVGGNGYYRGQLGLWKWDGVAQTLNRIEPFTFWPIDPFDSTPTFANSAFAANVDIDSDIEVVTAGEYGSSPDVNVWSWSGTSFQWEAGSWSTMYDPAAWNGVSVGNVDGDPSNVQEIVTVGYGTDGSDIVGLLQIWHTDGTTALDDQLDPEHTWSSTGHMTTANSTYVGPIDASDNIRILTIGSSEDVYGIIQQEMKVFDWDGSSLSVDDLVTKQWMPPTAFRARGNSVYASDVDMDDQVEMLAFGVSISSGGEASALMSIWHWDGGTSDIELEKWESWRDPYEAAIGSAVYVANANGDLDDIPEILTASTVTYLIDPGPPYDPFPSRKAQLRLWDWNLPPPINVWTEFTNPSGDHPSARREHSMAYHSKAQRTILFGGVSSTAVEDDTWEYNAKTHTWSELHPKKQPSPRAEAAMDYDSISDSIILFGGGVYGGPISTQTWEFKYGTPPSWELLVVTGDVPPPLYSATMIYDEGREIFYLWGGFDWTTMTYKTDMYTFDRALSKWTNIGGSDQPPGRMEHSMVFDCERDKIVVFGGWTGPHDGEYYESDETWEYDPGSNSWAKIVTADSPSARQVAAMAYDSQGGVTILFGGLIPSGSLGDTWKYDGTNWYNITSGTHPSARCESWMVYDTIANRGILFGGLKVPPYPGVYNYEWWEYRYS